MLANWWIAFCDQGPPARFFKNLFNGEIHRVLKRRSHYNENGTPKIQYGRPESALKAVNSMALKTGHRFSSYKCFYCPGYHIGKD
jgi:spermidine synthase